MRTLAAVEAGTSSVLTSSGNPWKVAIDKSTIHYLLGDSLPNRVAFKTAYPASVSSMWVGYPLDTYFTQTNPFVKDKKGVTITTGLLTIQRQLLTLQDSSGFIFEVTSDEGTVTIEHNGRVVGDPNNIVGREVVTNLTESISVGREVRKFKLTLRARTWLPFVLTRMEWVGQFFNRTQRGV
jgi:hypothetical protein